MASGKNLWMWSECIGVVSGCCCKEVYRFPHITYPYSTCISSLFVATAHFSVNFRMIFVLVYCTTIFA